MDTHSSTPSENEQNQKFSKAILSVILQNLPHEWRGTTFKNSALLGREKFASKLLSLIADKGLQIIETDLVEIGNAEDYLRVSSNVSSVLECYLAQKYSRDISSVFTFSSQIMGIIAVLLTSGRPVRLYTGKSGSPLDTEQIAKIALIGCSLTVHSGSALADDSATVLSTENAFECSEVDAVVQKNVLYINNSQVIDPTKIMVIRKRMATPLTTPAALAMLESLADIPVVSNKIIASDESIKEFYAHLQTLSGVETNSKSYPACFTAGLPAICSFWMTLIFSGGADILMASTAYGGSSQLTDLLNLRSAYFNKHNFDITGTRNLSSSIKEGLDKLASDPASLMPTTVLFVEIPTNPDMKVPDILFLAQLCQKYHQVTDKEIILFVDTTFAPSSQVMQKISTVAPGLTTMTFISMSKSVSRGLTTAGAIVAGPSERAQQLLEKIRSTSLMLDTQAKPDQILILAEAHIGVETRCAKAYQVAVEAGDSLCQAVKTYCDGYQMPLAFVTPSEAALGFTSSTFSFNLPPLKDPEANEALAQRFVNLLCEESIFKPCVSFGQDNKLIYATVPATSTQGAIKAEEKAKQAVGGVQLTRLSFPPTCNIELACTSLTNAVKKCYN